MADQSLVPVPESMINRETASGTSGELFIRLVDPLDAISMPLSISPLLICHEIKAEFDYFRKRVKNHGLRKLKACSLLRLAKERFNAASNMPFDLFPLWAYQCLHRDDAPTTGAEIFHELLTWCDAFNGPGAQINTDRLVEVSDLLGCRYTSLMLAFGLYTGYRDNSESVHILNCIYSFVVLQGQISHEQLGELNFLERAIFMAGTFRSIRASCSGFSSSDMFPSAIEVALAVESCVQQSAIMNKTASPALAQISSSIPPFRSVPPAQSAETVRLLSAIRFGKKRPSPLKNKRISSRRSRIHNQPRRRCQSTPPFSTRSRPVDVMTPETQMSEPRAAENEATGTATTVTQDTQTQETQNRLDTSNTSRTSNTQVQTAASSSQQPVNGSSFSNRRPGSLPKQNRRPSDSSSDEEDNRPSVLKRPMPDSDSDSDSSESDSEEDSSDGDGPPAPKRRRNAGNPLAFSRRAPHDTNHRRRPNHSRPHQAPQFSATTTWQLAPPSIPVNEATSILAEENTLQEQFLNFVTNFHGNFSDSGVRYLSGLVERHQAFVQRRQWYDEQVNRRLSYRTAVADASHRTEPQSGQTLGASGVAAATARTSSHHIPAQPQGGRVNNNGNHRPFVSQGTREHPHHQYAQHQRVGHAHVGSRHAVAQHIFQAQYHQPGHCGQCHQRHDHHQNQQAQQAQQSHQHQQDQHRQRPRQDQPPQGRRVYYRYSYQPRGHAQTQAQRAARGPIAGDQSLPYIVPDSTPPPQSSTQAQVSGQRPQNSQAGAPPTPPLVAPQPRPPRARLDENRITGNHTSYINSEGYAVRVPIRQSVEIAEVQPSGISQAGPSRDVRQGGHELEITHDEDVDDEDMDETDRENGQALT